MECESQVKLLKFLILLIISELRYPTTGSPSGAQENRVKFSGHYFSEINKKIGVAFSNPDPTIKTTNLIFHDKIE